MKRRINCCFDVIRVRQYGQRLFIRRPVLAQVCLLRSDWSIQYLQKMCPHLARAIGCSSAGSSKQTKHSSPDTVARAATAAGATTAAGTAGATGAAGAAGAATAAGSATAAIGTAIGAEAMTGTGAGEVASADATALVL